MMRFELPADPQQDVIDKYGSTWVYDKHGGCYRCPPGLMGVTWAKLLEFWGAA